MRAWQLLKTGLTTRLLIGVTCRKPVREISEWVLSPTSTQARTKNPRSNLQPTFCQPCTYLVRTLYLESQWLKNTGLLSMNYRLLGGMAAYHFRLLGVPGKAL